MRDCAADHLCGNYSDVRSFPWCSGLVSIQSSSLESSDSVWLCAVPARPVRYLPRGSHASGQRRERDER